MLKHNKPGQECGEFNVKYGLDSLLKRLKPGTEVTGRIVDVISENRYLLRIWGYNILTDSQRSFNKFEEVDLKVLQVEPHLVLDIRKKGGHRSQSNSGMNIVV